MSVKWPTGALSRPASENKFLFINGHLPFHTGNATVVGRASHGDVTWQIALTTALGLGIMWAVNILFIETALARVLWGRVSAPTKAL
jgi:hypothetical protein